MTTTFTIIETPNQKTNRKQDVMNLNGGRWVRGAIGQYCYEAKIYPAGSEYGIHDGNISKLCIRNTATKREEVAFDRDWDILPADEQIREMVDALVEFYA